MLIILLLAAAAPSSAFWESLLSEGLNCTSNEFQCSNSKCINLNLRCDDKKNCDDGSDEIDCGKYLFIYLILFKLFKSNKASFEHDIISTFLYYCLFINTITAVGCNM